MRRNLIQLASGHFNKIPKVSGVLDLKILNAGGSSFLFCIFFKNFIEIPLDFFPVIKLFRQAFLYDSAFSKNSRRIIIDGIFNEIDYFFCVTAIGKSKTFFFKG